MTIKDVLKITATYLGRDRVVSSLENIQQPGKNSDILAILNDLTRCANLVLNELSLSYVPMKKTQKIKVNSGKVYYSELFERPIKIIKVTDNLDNPLYYESYDEYIEVNSQSVKVTYQFIPSNYGLHDTIGYEESDIPARIIAYGVAAEYCLILKAFDESVMWHKRYMEALSEMFAPKNAKIKKRAWI